MIAKPAMVPVPDLLCYWILQLVAQALLQSAVSAAMADPKVPLEGKLMVPVYANTTGTTEFKHVGQPAVILMIPTPQDSPQLAKM